MSNAFNVSAYNPDILSCIADLSSDEIFTPPAVANAMLDMLPQELFRDPNATFLDPAAKSGVFLREIAKRLLVGLEEAIPDLQERIDHIFGYQIYGIAITEITSLLARRSVYCSKTANGNYSVCRFDDVQGNIRYKRIQHKWNNGRCLFCGASQSQYDRDESLETHAYEFIHTTKPEDIFHMKFDVIISNPPYQLSDGGHGASAIPIYQKFVQQAKKLNPRYMTMIIPSRWFAGGRGLDSFRQEMLSDRRIRVIVDYFNSEECFPGIDLSGGVCYFLWDRDHTGDCRISSSVNGKITTLTRPLLEDNAETYIRFNEAVNIVRKVSKWNKRSFSDIVSTQKPFGLRTYILGEPKSTSRTIVLYSNRNAAKEQGYISLKDIPQNREWVNQYKVLVSAAYGERGDFPYQVLGKPFIAGPGTCCSETFLVIGPFETNQVATNVITYIQTKFFRFLVLLKKSTQHTNRAVYSFVPLQDFSHPWTDEELYAKYGLTDEEISFIESMIKPMELGGDSHA